MASMDKFVRGALVLGVAAGALGWSRATAGPVLLFEPARDVVLLSEDPDRPWHPASVTKLMTAYLTFEAVKAGRLAWDQKLPLSEKARAQPATRIGLKAGISLNVDQAVRGLILRSANDFAMVLAEAIGGSEEGFAVQMNATAKRLGMSRSNFGNPHGLPDGTQVTTARDLAVLVSALQRDFPAQSDVFSKPDVAIGKGVFHSQNSLLRTLPGADGMKTGFTCASGYNVVASATRNGRRLVAIVLGDVSGAIRTQHATELLEAGFLHIEGKTPLTETKLAELPVAPSEEISAADMTRLARTRKCGNREGEPRRPVARAKKATKKAVAATTK